MNRLRRCYLNRSFGFAQDDGRVKSKVFYRADRGPLVSSLLIILSISLSVLIATEDYRGQIVICGFITVFSRFIFGELAGLLLN